MPDQTPDPIPTPEPSPRRSRRGQGRGANWFGPIHWPVLLSVTALVMGFVVWVLWVTQWLKPVLNTVWPYSAQARIYVEPPQVYTRERLVNDRFRELTWLETELRNLDSSRDRAPSSAFGSLRDGGIGISVGGQAGGDISVGGQADGDIAGTPNAAPASLPAQQLDQNEAFNLDFQRRVAVRSEIMNTLLDDGHDLAGSTLYRLNFDVSIIPRQNARGFGLVAIDVEPGGCVGNVGSECDSEDLARVVRAYRRLLNAWEQDLQAFLSKIYKQRTSVQPGMSIIDPFGGDPAPKERMAFNWYLKARTVEAFLDLVVGADCSIPGYEAATEAACPVHCQRRPNDWWCNAAVRRDAVHAILGWPGSSTQLPAELSLRFEQGFSNEIRHFSDAMTTTLRLGELKRFFGAFNTSRQVWQEQQAAGATTTETNAAPKPTDKEQKGKDAADLLQALREAGIDTEIGIDLEKHKALIGYLAALPAASPPTEELTDANVERLTRSVMGSHGCRTGAATPAGNDPSRFALSTPCPTDIQPRLANLHGLVQLAGRLERVRFELLDGKNGSNPIATLPNPDDWPRQLLDQRITDVYQCLYTTHLLTPELLPDDAAGHAATKDAGKACARLVGADPEDTDAVEKVFKRIRKANQPLLGKQDAGHAQGASEQQSAQAGPPAELDARSIRELFDKAFADFFVDRLRRNDIPGYQPSPPVDRFFSIRTSGCESGGCDVLISRKRWLTRADYLSSGKALLDRLHGCPGESGTDSESKGAECERKLRPLLPTALGYCKGETQMRRCVLLLRAAVAAAEDNETDRSILQSADALSNYARYEQALNEQFRAFSACLCPKSADQSNGNTVAATCKPYADPQDGASAVPDCTRKLGKLPSDMKVVRDFVETINALEFKSGLAARAGDAGVKVYAVEPRTRGVATQESVRRAERLRTTLRLRGEQIGKQVGDDRLLEGIGDAVQTLERITARNTVIGFGHLRGSGADDDCSNEASDASPPRPRRRADNDCSEKAADASTGPRQATFGWMFLPNRLDPGGWLNPDGRATHTPGSYRLSAVLSLPSWWTEVKLRVRQCWGLFGRVEESVMSEPYAKAVQCDGKTRHAGLAPAGYDDYFLPLPASTERITEVFEFEVIKVPFIDSREERNPAEIEAGRKGQLVIEGGRLWRGTMVTLGEQQADEIVVLPDMRGVVAKFTCIRPPPRVHHVMKYAESSKGAMGKKDPTHGPIPVKLTVWTAQGNASLNQALIWPFKERWEGEKPCWLWSDGKADGGPSRPERQQAKDPGGVTPVARAVDG